MAKTRTLLIVGFGVWALGLGHRALSAQGARTVWDGVYTATQAERGARLFADSCAGCHGAEMKGGPGAPGLIGPEFQFSWNKKTAGALFDYAKAFMPPGQPGSLSDQQYAEVLAAIFQANDMPASANALPSTKAELETITILGTRP